MEVCPYFCEFVNLMNLFKLLNAFSDRGITIVLCQGLVRIVTSAEERSDILRENHISPLGGHRGIKKTLHRIRQNYFWPTIKGDVTDLVRRCPQCQTMKVTTRHTRQPMIITDSPARAMEKLSMDIMGHVAHTPSRRRLRLRGAYQPPSIISMRISIFYPVFPKFMQTSNPHASAAAHTPAQTFLLALAHLASYSSLTRAPRVTLAPTTT